MRYYEVNIPGRDEPIIATNIRSAKNLPEGTRVFRTITDRDGSLISQDEIPVANGRPQVRGRGKQRPQVARPTIPTYHSDALGAVTIPEDES